MPMATEAPLAAEPFIDIDMSERAAKRARHFAPLRRSYVRKKSIIVGHDSDGEENQEDEGRSEYTRGQTKWQEDAGLYKNANTLLHDLHAEQRHRQLFAATPSYTTSSQRDLYHPTFSHATSSMNLKHWTQSMVMPHPERDPPLSSPMYHSSSHAHPSVDHVEAQIVSSQYEDTNRFLRNLFLSRRRRLDHEQT
ncbi:hypothetical protein DAEQUDRAFT_760828 [Daedalea quercina L-15889]|uniref:Uncharacterized protein n=1 Tax=Daedalea quercina L-15889 TaxID=1314783 RepID=A0A165UF49_9APHY|nr:hypothetical protein DAEQUDRAFT_760828 [Daedalea quercina L-15889]